MLPCDLILHTFNIKLKFISLGAFPLFHYYTGQSKRSRLRWCVFLINLCPPPLAQLFISHIGHWAIKMKKNIPFMEDENCDGMSQDHP